MKLYSPALCHRDVKIPLGPIVDCSDARSLIWSVVGTLRESSCHPKSFEARVLFVFVRLLESKTLTLKEHRIKVNDRVTSSPDVLTKFKALRLSRLPNGTSLFIAS